jgi:23S rRNA pseudouridine1911/1915/1917 synthase
LGKKPKNDFGRIENNIGRSPRDRKSFAVVERGGKIAITEYKVLERFLYTSLLQFRLKTGRTHQIRVHSADIGHKLFGDERLWRCKSFIRWRKSSMEKQNA